MQSKNIAKLLSPYSFLKIPTISIELDKVIQYSFSKRSKKKLFLGIKMHVIPDRKLKKTTFLSNIRQYYDTNKKQMLLS